MDNVFFPGSFFQERIESLIFIYAENPLAGPSIAAWVLIAGFSLFLYIVYEFGKFYFALRKGNKILSKYTDERTFAENYELIENSIKSVKVFCLRNYLYNIFFFVNFRTPKLSNTSGSNFIFSRAWEEFRETLLVPDMKNDIEFDRVFKNTLRPSEFFFYNSIIQKWWKGLVDFSPNLFVGVGLALTFFGLIAALNQATGTFSSENVETAEIQKALGQLLNVTSAKFYASLTALIISLVLNITLRVAKGTINSQLYRFCDKLENGIRYISSEEINQLQLDEISKQTQQLTKFNTDLAIQIGSSIEESMKPVQKTFEDVAKSLGQDNLNAIQKIGEEVAKDIQGSAKQSLTTLSTELNTLSTTLGNLAGKLETSTSGFENNVSESLSKLSKGMEGLIDEFNKNAENSSNKVSDQLQEMCKKLTDAASIMQDSMVESSDRVLTRLDDSIQKLSDATERSADKIENAIDQMKEALNSISEALNKASEDAAEKLRDDIIESSKVIKQKFNESGDTFNEKLKEVAAESAKSFQDAGEALANILNDHADNFKKSIQEFNSSLDNSSQQASALGLQLDKNKSSFEEIIGKLNLSSTMLDGSLQEIQKSLDPIRNSVLQIDKSTTNMEEGSTAIRNSVSELKEANENVMNAWENYSSKFDQTDVRLGNILEKMQASMQETLSSLESYTIKVDTSFGNSMTALQGFVEELSEIRSGNKANSDIEVPLNE